MNLRLVIFFLHGQYIHTNHIHLVFAVKNRASLINPDWKHRLYKYTTGIFQSNGHKILAINGVPDHIHILIGFRPHQPLSAVVQNVKTETSKWIKRECLCFNFSWQEGYGAFSYSKSQLPTVINYINNQEAHHAKMNFETEFRKMLDSFGIDYDEKYIFKQLS
jgi:putative transposase